MKYKHVIYAPRPAKETQYCLNNTYDVQQNWILFRICDHKMSMSFFRHVVTNKFNCCVLNEVHFNSKININKKC